MDACLPRSGEMNVAERPLTTLWYRLGLHMERVGDLPPRGGSPHEGYLGRQLENMCMHP